MEEKLTRDVRLNLHSNNYVCSVMKKILEEHMIDAIVLEDEEYITVRISEESIVLLELAKTGSSIKFILASVLADELFGSPTREGFVNLIS